LPNNRIAMGLDMVTDAVSAAMRTCMLEKGTARVFAYRFRCDPELLPTDYKFVCSVKCSLAVGAQEAKNVYRDAKNKYHFIKCK